MVKIHLKLKKINTKIILNMVLIATIIAGLASAVLTFNQIYFTSIKAITYFETPVTANDENSSIDTNLKKYEDVVGKIESKNSIKKSVDLKNIFD
jgi:hypothetical protein